MTVIPLAVPPTVAEASFDSSTHALRQADAGEARPVTPGTGDEVRVQSALRQVVASSTREE